MMTVLSVALLAVLTVSASVFSMGLNMFTALVFSSSSVIRLMLPSFCPQAAAASAAAQIRQAAFAFALPLFLFPLILPSSSISRYDFLFSHIP